jgi:hypothetical protein
MSSPLLLGSEDCSTAYTDLFASISEEEGSFTLQFRLYNMAKAENAAWGEEVTDCFEKACMLIATLAAEFSIPQENIDIELRMNNSRDGTRH